MTDGKHTAAPWYFAIDTDDDAYFRVYSATCRICDVERWHGDNDPDTMAEAHANARLIATAPRLFEAIKRTLKFLEDIAEHEDLDKWERHQAQTMLDHHRSLIRAVERRTS